MYGHEEKVPVVRLTVVQYAVLLMFLVLAYRLWRLQVMQSDEYTTGGEEPGTQCADSGAAGQNFRSRRPDRRR